jgi:hypothetical protein
VLVQAPQTGAKWRVGQPDYVGGHHLDGGLLLAVGGELRRVGGDPFSRVEQSRSTNMATTVAVMPLLHEATIIKPSRGIGR